MAEKGVGSPISEDVLKQLRLREDLIGEKNKSRDHLLFFNSNGAWVRLASSVNTLTEKDVVALEAQALAKANKDPSPTGPYPQGNQQSSLLYATPTLADIPGSNVIAKNNVLFGGMYPDGNKPGGGILSTKWHTPTSRDDAGYITPGSEKAASYHNYQSLGHRPVPGIGSMTVTSKNTYGTLREAEVKITVWTVEDLELMQTIYLRPGYSMLLEWGHSLGLDDQKNIIQDISTYSGFLEGKKEQNDIEDALIKNRKDTYFNYDGMYGYVSNFSWAFRQDGGYDCTLKIISKGAILESLAVCFNTGDVYPTEQINSGNEDQAKTESRSIFHKFRAELNKAEKTDKKFKAPNSANIRGAATNADHDQTIRYVEKDNFKDETGGHFKETLNDFRAFPLRIEYDKQKKGSDETSESFKDVFYVPLSVILDIFNNYVSNENPKGKPQQGVKSGGYRYSQFYTGWQDTFTASEPTSDGPKEYYGSSQEYRDRQAKLNTSPTTGPYLIENKFLTTEYQFSFNPTICLIEGQLGYRELKLNDANSNPLIPKNGDGVDSTLYNTLGTVQVSNLDLAVKHVFNTVKQIKGRGDDILNILVNFDHLIGILDQVIGSDTDSDQNTSNNIITILQKLLKDINNSLGGVNDLDVVYDEDRNLNIIVDRRLTPTKVDQKSKLRFTGLNSTISNLEINSTISSNISSQVSIAAQGGNQGTKDNIGPLLQWNKGLIDRHLPEKVRPNRGNTPEDIKRKAAENLQKWLEDYVEVWKGFTVTSRKVDTSLKVGVTFTGFSLPTFFGGFYPNPSFVDKTTLENLESLSSYHKKYSQKYVAERYYRIGDKDTPPPGVIPVELSFTTIGIGGLIIGQSFQLEGGILPPSYDNFGFIITGLNHTLSGNRWNTEVKTQFFMLEAPSAYNKQQFKQEVREEETPPPEQSTPPTTVPDTNKVRTAIQNLHISETGLEEIKAFELFKAKAYDDFKPKVTLTKDTPIAGTLTVGYGFTAAVIPSLRWDTTITQQAADALLRKKIVGYENRVKQNVKVPLTQGEFDALVSIAYNAGEIGNTSAGKSTPLQNTLNNQEYLIAADIIPEYRVTSKGKIIQGLINRRKSEQTLFLS